MKVVWAQGSFNFVELSGTIRCGSGLGISNFLPILQPAKRYLTWVWDFRKRSSHHQKDVRFMTLGRPEVGSA